MFLHPFPKRSPVNVSLVKTKALVLIELSGQALSCCFVNVVLMLLSASPLQRMGRRVEGLVEVTVWPARPEGSSPVAAAAAL